MSTEEYDEISRATANLAQRIHQNNRALHALRDLPAQSDPNYAQRHHELTLEAAALRQEKDALPAAHADVFKAHLQLLEHLERR